MRELTLKYGINPNQQSARIYSSSGGDLPLKILNGNPGYINLLDALNAWQLVSEAKKALNTAVVTSFKHLSPTSAATARALHSVEKQMYFVEQFEEINQSPLAIAYARARGTDRLSSFGDFVALSEECDLLTAQLIAREVSDGVIAPSYQAEALEVLKRKRNGKYNIIEIDANYQAPAMELRDVFGIRFEQQRNDYSIDESDLDNIVTAKKDLPSEVKKDLILALITLKYTQSNSICLAYNGQTIAVGAGQQSRVHCTRLAANKADLYFLRSHPKVLALPFKPEVKRVTRDNVIEAYISKTEEDVCQEGNWQKYFTTKVEPLSAEEKEQYLKTIKGVSLASDAFFPFADSVIRAAKSGVEYVVQAGGSIRDQEVIACCDQLGITMAFNRQRLFHH